MNTWGKCSTKQRRKNAHRLLGRHFSVLLKFTSDIVLGTNMEPTVFTVKNSESEIYFDFFFF